ncbi:MAG: alpha/beta fold hydrolase [Acidimicrobiales bacterium]
MVMIDPQPVAFVGRGGLRLAADVRGEPGAPPVVLLHGGGQTRHSWDSAARNLAANGWRAYTVDLRGHGNSDWSSEGAYELEDFAGDVTAIAGSLEQPPALVGASLGGLSSLLATGESETDLARALVLVDVAPHIEQGGVDRIRDFMSAHLEDGFGSLGEVADAVAAYNPHRPRPADLSGLRKNVRQRDDGRWVWHWDPKFHRGPEGPRDEPRTAMIPPERLDAAARSIGVPILLVRGRVSDLLSEEGARQFLELVPDAEFVDVEGAGHMVAGDRNDHFNNAVVTFLDRTLT